jgi:hypothetical protein
MFLRRSKKRYLTLIACFLAGLVIFAALQNLPPPPPVPISSDDKHRSKVFIIGLSKTGTTSLGDALSRLSFRRVGWEDIRSRLLFHSYLDHNLSPLITLTHSYDAFEDLPWPLVYQDMALLYPDAKFILSRRKDEQSWLRSITEHTARRKWIGHDFTYGAGQAKGHEGTYLEAYRNHTSSVRSFFASHGNGTRLLEWVIDERETVDEDKELWGILLRFLDMEDTEEMRIELGEFPWSNQTDSWRGRYIYMGILKLWDRVMYYLEGVLLGSLL